MLQINNGPFCIDCYEKTKIKVISQRLFGFSAKKIVYVIRRKKKERKIQEKKKEKMKKKEKKMKEKKRKMKKARRIPYF